MSSVSRDNKALTEAVMRVKGSYADFQTALRGAVAEVLNGLGNGTYNLSNMVEPFNKLAERFLATVREQIYEDLGNLSERSLKTSGVDLLSGVASKHVTVADALYKGFSVEVESAVERAVSKDVKTSLEFIRTQISQGRFVATTEQLAHDLEFTVTGKVRISSAEFVSREVNWSYRQHYNTIMVHVLLDSGTDYVVVDGGSSDGLKLNLMQYDMVQAKIFHHNSKSLLQPLDEGI